MHITRVEAWPVHLKCEPYTIAYETVESTTNVFVRLHTNGPLVGYGVAAPDLHVTGETPEDVLTALGQAEAILKGQGVERPAELYRRLRDELGWLPSTLAALDMAVLDLHSQSAGMPLYKVLGGARDRILTSVTIGILDERGTIEEAQRWLKRGFRSLKLKGGLDVHGDIARLLKVREVIGQEVELSFDANQGYSLSDAKTFVRACADIGLLYVEQPTRRESVSDLFSVQRDSPIPIMADESITTLGEALQLAGNIPLFNIKLQKVGGTQAALSIDGITSMGGGALMVGCLDECALSVAGGLHFALGRPSVCFADLDSHFTLLDDPTAGAVIFRDGYLYPGERLAPGDG